MRFIRAYVLATDWLRNPANHDEALQIFERVTKLTREAAQSAYRLLLTSDDGIQARGKIDVEGIRTVLKLRSEYGQPHRALGTPRNTSMNPFIAKPWASSRSRRC